MSASDRLTLMLAVFTGIGLPTLGLTVRALVKWTRVEDALNDLVKDVQQLVESKDKVHERIYAAMEDNASKTDRRLRWLEENLWKRGGGQNG